MKVSKKDRAGNNGRNWSQSVELRDGKMWADSKTPFGRTSKKPEEDDRPKATPKDRNTGSPLSRKLAGKVIG
jgi:hypothetical protein